jgi:predicted dehydrogenase
VALVTVAMPSYLHAPWSIQALQAGKHTVCEKPMATSLKDADKMIAASKKAGKVLTIFQNARYKADFLKVREVIQSGKLGRVILIRIVSHHFSRRWDWQTLQKFGGGTLNNTCPHLIDQALQLFGNEEPEVFSHLERALTLGDAEDHVKIVLKGRKAPQIDIEVTAACAYPQSSWLVMGTRGGLTVDNNRLKWKYINTRKLLPRKVDIRPTPDRSYNGEKYSWKEESFDLSTSNIRSGKRPGEIGFYIDLYKTLRNKEPLAITPQSVRRQIALIEKVHQTSPIWNKKRR